MCRTLGAVVLFFVLVSVSVAEGRRPVTFLDLDGVTSSNSPVTAMLDLSPDGKRLAVNDRERRLRVFDAVTGHVLHDLGEGFLPLWAPDGRRLAYYSSRSGGLQIWIWDAKTLRSARLTSLPGGVDPDPTTRFVGFVTDAFRFDWSPDGGRIVFASRAAFPMRHPEEGPLVLDGTTSADLTLLGVFAQPGGGTGGVLQAKDGSGLDFRAANPGEKLINRLFVVQVATGKITRLDGGSGHLFHPVWSPDGRQVAYAAIAEDASIVFAKQGDIRLLDIDTGAERILLRGGGIKHRPRWSRDGSRLAYLASGTFSDRAMLHVADARNGAILYEHKPDGLDLSGNKYDWASEGDVLLLPYADDGSKLGRLRPGNVIMEPLLPAEVGPSWAQARDGTLAWIQGRTGPDVWILPLTATEPARLLELAVPESTLQLGRIEHLSYKTGRGFSLEGALLYPPDHTAGKKYPLIVDTYPLVSGNSWMHPMYGNHAWAAAGYLVFKPYRARAPHVWPNCSGEPDFCNASKGPDAWDVMVDDVMSGVDALIGRGLVDSGRMCLYGHSNGGGVASYLVTRTDRFRCAVVVAPVWLSWVGAPLLGGRWELMSRWTGVNPLEDPAAYIRLSAVFHVNHVRTPIMLAAGDRDGMFLLGAIEMYNALRFAGKEVILLRYPDQGHIFTGAGLHDLWQREMAFFKAHLNPG